MGLHVLQWCHPMLACAKRTSYCTQIITLYGAWKVDSGLCGIGTGLPSPAEILHGRNLTTRVQAEIDIKAIYSVLQERQLKMMLDHDSSRRARKARLLVVGERCHVLGPGNKWIDAFITGITDSGRSYETQLEATGGQLMRNCSHIRPRSPDIHACFFLTA